VVRIGGHKAYTTQKVHEPKWFEKLYVGSHKKDYCIPVTKDFIKDLDIQFILWDSDFGLKNEFLGTATIKGADVIAGFDKWIDLKEDSEHKGKVTGRIYIKAKFVEKSGKKEKLIKYEKISI